MFFRALSAYLKKALLFKAQTIKKSLINIEANREKKELERRKGENLERKNFRQFGPLYLHISSFFDGSNDLDLIRYLKASNSRDHNIHLLNRLHQALVIA